MLAASDAQGQYAYSSGGTTTSGMFGSRSLGGGTTSNTQAAAARSASAGATGASGLAQGQTPLATGQAAMPFQTLQRAGFVGRDTTDTTNVRSQEGAGNQAANMFQSLFSGANSDFNNQNASQKPKLPLRLQLRIGFTPKPVATSQFTAKFASRLSRLPGLSAVGPIVVTMEGQTAVLQGRVATEADRELAQDLAMLEPEVLDVRNELLVGPPSDAELPPPLSP
jgi:hypothetical protein